MTQCIEVYHAYTDCELRAKYVACI